MTFSTVISRCIDKWQAEGLELAQPIAADEVRRVWSEFETELSADVLQLYSTIGGFQDYTFDEDFFWSLWPWDWLQERNREDRGAGVMFCDHSIGIETWELRYEDSKHSSVWSSDGKQTAPTLESFLNLYLQDPSQLL